MPTYRRISEAPRRFNPWPKNGTACGGSVFARNVDVIFEPIKWSRPEGVKLAKRDDVKARADKYGRR